MKKLFSAVDERLALSSPLKQGGESVIFRCFHKLLQKEFTLKVFSPLFIGEGPKLLKKISQQENERLDCYETKQSKYSQEFGKVKENDKFVDKENSKDSPEIWKKYSWRDRSKDIQEIQEINILRAKALRGIRLQAFLEEIELIYGKVPKVLTWGDEPFVYVLQQYIPAPTLIDWAKGKPLKKKLRIMLGIARFLHEIHRREIFHRDIKPSNILVWDGTPVFLDWSFAVSEREKDSAYTQFYHQQYEKTSGCGTAEYSYPPMLEDSTCCSWEADRYSFGLTLWSVLMELEPRFDLEIHEKRIPEKVMVEQMKKYDPSVLQSEFGKEITNIFWLCVEETDDVILMEDIANYLEIAITNLDPLKKLKEKSQEIKNFSRIDTSKIDWGKVPLEDQKNMNMIIDGIQGIILKMQGE